MNKKKEELDFSIRESRCRVCPIYVDGLCSSKLYLNVETGDVSTTLKDGYGQGCGCFMEWKWKNIDAKCPVGKW